MEIRVLGASLTGFADTAPKVVNVILDGGFDLVHVDFTTAGDELEVFDHMEADMGTRLDLASKLADVGRFTILERSGARIEVMGPIRDLAPALREIADAFDAKRRQLPG